MNLRPFTTGLIIAALFVPALVRAQGGPPPWAGGGQGRVARAAAEDGADTELAALDRFLDMSDAELDAMQQAIVRVRAMSPAERSKLREQIAAFHHLPEERRAEIRAGWGWHDAKDREDWRAMMQAKTPDERMTIQRELSELGPEERMQRKRAMLEAWRRDRAAAVAPPRAPG